MKQNDSTRLAQEFCQSHCAKVKYNIITCFYVTSRINKSCTRILQVFSCSKTCRIFVQVFFLCQSFRFLLFLFYFIVKGRTLQQQSVHVRPLHRRHSVANFSITITSSSKAFLHYCDLTVVTGGCLSRQTHTDIQTYRQTDRQTDR